jgi:hypothetical protein
MHVMIDLETLGAVPYSSILSLGAVMFDKDGLHSSFYNVFSRNGMRELYMTESPTTLAWWGTQKDDSVISCAGRVEEPVADALIRFSEWLGFVSLDGVWGNGSDFDNVLLACVYRAARLDVPWDFRQNRCYRTIKSLQPDKPITREYGDAHNALNDAQNQAAHLLRLISI